MMDSKLQMFQNKEFGKLEVLMIDGKPYFPASACAQILGYSNPHDAIKKHCPHLAKREVGVETGKKADGTPAYQTVGVNFIPEGDLYRLIIRSKLPAAERFEKWVFDDVLPTIRQHGAYITEEAIIKVLESPSYAMQLFRAAAAAQLTNAELKKQVDKLAPKARYYDIILQNKGAVQVSIIAKDYGMSAVSFNRLLHDAGVQYKSGKTWLLYQKYAGQGYTMSRTCPINDYAVAIHTYWTQKGRLFLYELLKEYGMLPQMEIDNAAACY